MAQTKLDIRQSETRALQDQINSAATTGMDSTLASINSELTAPGRLIAQSTPSLVVTVGTGTPVNPNTSKNRTLPFISNTYVNFAGGTITFPSGSGTITVSPGTNLAITIGASQFMAITVQLDSTGNLNLSAGTAAGTLSAALAAASPGSSSFLSLGLIVIQTNGSSVIQNITNSMLYQFGTGTGGSGGSGGLGDDLASSQFRADILDTFPESPSQSSTTIDNGAGKTNASYNAGKNIYAISYDASKTGTSTGTAFTLSGTPAFTVAAGDVVYNQVTGEVKKIASISSQTAYTLESAFASNLAATAVTVSQAVHTKDVYNSAIDSNGNTIASAFGSSTFSEIAVFYKDNSTSGSNTWAINTAANVGFIGSPDNSNWTTIQKRATNVTDQYSSTILPSAGTSLYLRFFSAKTSGSGTVNLIMYKAYMQKYASSPQGGVQFAAYGTTNNSTTPVGCTISVVGGKTTITLTGGNQYAVGVNSGQTYGACDVLLNGQLLPRFVSGTVPATDGYFTEVSGTVIQLDKDYSSIQLDVQVLVRAQIVDASTTNTTQISALQEINQNGFQGFVNTNTLMTATTTAGTPAAGSFYSSIPNRAALVDLSQDLKVRMGIERIETQQIYQIQNEFGPNGELIWGVPGDLFGQIRFVGGGWTYIADSNGARINSAPTVGTAYDYVEITFYGTGLNFLTKLDNASYDIRASVDGGSEGSNLMSASGSTVYNGRNYAANSSINAVSNLALGVHTVKLRHNDTADNWPVFGFEVLNESSSVKVNPGISYLNGKKLTLSSQSSFSYSAPVTGTKGGRVLVYQNADGSIGNAFQAVNASQLNLTSADHTNEEIARTYNFREFGAARSDDFSLLTSGTVSFAAFTLDDGTTCLTGNNIQTLTPPTLDGVCCFLSGTNGFLTVTFVGTGLDIKIGTDSTTRSFTAIYVDGGASIGTLSKTGSTNPEVRKIVSGLPYGTHTVKFENTSGTSTPVINQFIVYQPKKPSLPSGALELGDYNVLANYSAGTFANAIAISTGTLRKYSAREMVPVGTWSLSQDNTYFAGGWNLNSTTGASYIEYEFFGTGIEYGFKTNSGAGGALNTTISIDGSSNLSGFTTSYAPASTGTTFTASTGTISGTSAGQGDSGLSITGLTLGIHKIRITQNGTGTSGNLDYLGVITPIHSYKSNQYFDAQNTLSVGSNAISDNRKITPSKDTVPSQKYRGVAIGVASSPTTSSTVYVPVPDLSLTVPSKGGWFRVSSTIEIFNTANSTSNNFTTIYVNAVQESAFETTAFTSASGTATGANHPISKPIYLPAGVHRVDLYWKTNAGTIENEGIRRILSVEEL